MNKNLILIFIIIVVIAILSWISLFSTKEKPVAIQVVKESPAQQHQSISSIFPDTEQFDESETFKKSDLLFEDFENIVSGLNLDTQQQVLEINLLPQPPTNVDTVTVEQQIFDMLFPDYVIAFYTNLQKSYIDDGYLDENYQKIENFDSEEKIFAFVNTSINIAEEQGFISRSDARKFRIGTNQVWKNIFEEEKMQLQQKIIGSEFYKRIFANRLYHLHKSTSKKIVSFFESMKNAAIPKTYAADCYRSGAASPGGTNNSGVWCCNCGVNCYGNYCVSVPDCGTLCNYRNYGCKNGPGGGFRPVIWDSASGICGVG